MYQTLGRKDRQPGYGSSNDGYTMRTDAILAGVLGKPDKADSEKTVDDVIQWSGNINCCHFWG